MAEYDRTAERDRIWASAQELYDAGLSIFPLIHPWEDPEHAKRPAVRWKRYQQHRPTRKRIEEWFADESRLHNIALVTGPLSGVVALDLDDDEAVREAHEADIPFPAKSVRTSGGEHWFYAWDDTHPVGNRARLVLGGDKRSVDVRGAGGYVAAPGSRHKSGHIYAYQEDSAPWTSLTPLPEELKSIIKPRSRLEAEVEVPRLQSDEEVTLVLREQASAKTRLLLQQGCEKGERNVRVYAAARDLHGLGVPKAIFYELIEGSPLEYNRNELRDTVESAYSQPALPAVMYTIMDEDDLDEAAEERSIQWAGSDERSSGVAEKSSGDSNGPSSGFSSSASGAADSSVQLTNGPRETPTPESSGEASGGPSDSTSPRSSTATTRTDDTVEPNDLRQAAGKPIRPTNVGWFDQEREDNQGKTKVETIYYARPLKAVCQEITGGFRGWPKAAGEVLFAPNKWDGTTLATDRNVQWLAKPQELFGWLHMMGDGVLWKTGAVRAGITDSSLVTLPTKEEAHAAMVRYAENYDAMELLWHQPTLPGLFYLVPRLPEVDPTLPRWQEFTSLLNPDTAVDAVLLKAALLTPLWGGPPGTRPAFLLESRYGRGSGKTSTAEAIASVYGGSVRAGERGRGPGDVAKQLVSHEGITKRVVIWDNLKGRKNYAEVEDWITSPTIQGHRLHVGHTIRPNLVTWFLTANVPEASMDLAQRVVPIAIGKPQHHRNFHGEVREFLDAHRMQLLAEMVHILAAKAAVPMPAEANDRWQAWAHGVLAKLDGGNEVFDLVKERRAAMDVDADDAQQLFDLLASFAFSQDITDAEEIVVPIRELADRGQDRGVHDMSSIGFGRWLNAKIEAHELPHVTQDRCHVPNQGRLRCVVWRPDAAQRKEYLDDSRD